MEALYSLLPSTHHVRLLRLEKNHLGEVDASMEAVDLTAEPEYTCLSYTWGGPRWEDKDEDWAVPRYPVLINGHILHIGLNLRNALNNLPGTLQGRGIWIDAICINQEDLLERNAQVALMSRIYGQAWDVVVWLGEATPRWERAIQNMDRFTLTLEGYWNAYAEIKKAIHDAFLACMLTNEEHMEIIQFLTGNRWFSRVWTLQEHLLARETRFLCGDVLASSQTIWKGSTIAMCAGVTTIWPDLDVCREEWNKEFNVTVATGYRYKGEPKESLGTNAHRYRSRLATDPKDKVFGVFGISRTTDKWIKEPFVVDYSLSIQEIYTKAAVYGLVAWKGLEALCHVGDRTENQISDLPSWVPDFTQVLPWKAFQKTGEHAKFKAASDLETQLWLSDADKKAVIVNASPIDSVIGICDAYWGNREKSGMSDFLKLLFKPSDPAKVYEEDVASVLLRLIVADGFNNNGVDPRDNLTELFEEWLFSGLFCCNEAHRGEAESAIAFWRNPKAQLPFMAEALGIRCPLLEDLLEPIVRGAKRCKTIEDIELSHKGRSQANHGFARYMPSTQHELRMQWQVTGMNRRFFRTAHGYIGVGPRTVEVGDRVVLLHGAHVPYIFRHLPKDPETVFDFVGEAYLHGFMYGEALEKEDLSWGKITLY